MLTGKHPYEIKSLDDDIFEIILTQKYDRALLYQCGCSDEAIDIVNMLVKNSDKRLSTEECLSHPWIKKFNTAETV